MSLFELTASILLAYAPTASHVVNKSRSYSENLVKTQSTNDDQVKQDVLQM